LVYVAAPPLDPQLLPLASEFAEIRAGTLTIALLKS
jgi:hypothetical protein